MIGSRAKKRREELGLTQASVALMCGITQQAYEKLESGNTLRPRYIVELSEALKVPPKWLLSGGDIRELGHSNMDGCPPLPKHKGNKAVGRERDALLQGIFTLLNNASLNLIRASNKQIKDLITFEKDIKIDEKKKGKLLQK